jgi:hypothetical protein
VGAMTQKLLNLVKEWQKILKNVRW